MSLLIPRSVVRDLRTCFDNWAGIRQRAKPLLHPMPSEERWAGQISMSEILEGKLKIEDLARINSTSVSTLLPVISPRELLWRDISLLQVSKGTKSWILVLRGSWPHWPPTSRWNEQYLSIFRFFNRWRRANDSICNLDRSKQTCPYYSGCGIVNNVWFQSGFFDKVSAQGYTIHFKRPKLIFPYISL